MTNDYYNSYKNLLKLDEFNGEDDIITLNKQMVNDNFSNFLFSETVLINDIGYSAIVKQEKKSEDKKLILKPDTKISVGSVVEISNSSYLVLNFLSEGIHEIYPTGTLKLCNYNLEFQSSNYQIQELPCVVYNSTNTNDGIDSDKYMKLPYGKIGILIQENNLTKEFTRDKRFFIKGEVWTIEFIGKLKDGLYDIVLTEDTIDVNKDRVDLGIANYIEPTSNSTIPTVGYAVKIIGDSEIINNQSKSYQVKWYNDGIEIVDSISNVNLTDNSLTAATFSENTISLTADRTNKGMVTMTVTSVTNGIVGTKDIQIKGLW